MTIKEWDRKEIKGKETKSHVPEGSVLTVREIEIEREKLDLISSKLRQTTLGQTQKESKEGKRRKTKSREGTQTLLPHSLRKSRSDTIASRACENQMEHN